MPLHIRALILFLIDLPGGSRKPIFSPADPLLARFQMQECLPHVHFSQDHIPVILWIQLSFRKKFSRCHVQRAVENPFSLFSACSVPDSRYVKSPCFHVYTPFCPLLRLFLRAARHYIFHNSILPYLCLKVKKMRFVSRSSTQTKPYRKSSVSVCSSLDFLRQTGLQYSQKQRKGRWSHGK